MYTVVGFSGHNIDRVCFVNTFILKICAVICMRLRCGVSVCLVNDNIVSKASYILNINNDVRDDLK